MTKTVIQPSSFERMSDDLAQLRLKAEASRRLADLSEDTARKELWLQRAVDWEQLARKAER